MLIGYEYDGGIIYKDSRTSWNGNTIVDGYEVVARDKNGLDGKRLYYASTLKKAKEFVENGCRW